MNHQTGTLRSEVSIIPMWARVLAVLSFVMFLVLLPVLFQRDPSPPPLWLQGIVIVIASTVLAVLILLVGYVNRDAGRRGMNRLVWTLLVIFVPNALGFVIYFLMRQPILESCPRCGAAVRPDFNFCPRCDYQLAPTCPNCGRGVRPGDVFCVQCGTTLEGAADRPASAEPA